MINKSILLLFSCFLITFITKAQSNDFLGKWSVSSYTMTFQGEETVLFHEDSLNNELDFEHLAISFMEENTAEMAHKEGDPKLLNWSFNEAEDTLLLDDKFYRIESKSANEFTTLAFTLEIASNDESEIVLDTAYYRMKFNYVPVLGDNRPSQKANSSGMELFPNPTQNTVNIQFNNPNLEVLYTIKLTEIDGREILSFECNQRLTQIDISHLDKGMYIISSSPKGSSDFDRQPLLIK